MFRAAIVSIATTLALALPVTAQPLADRVPADAMAYFGWAGAESMGPGFDESHLKALLDSAEVGRWVNEVMPQLAEALSRQQDMPAGEVRTMSGLFGPMWRHPTAIYVGPPDVANPKQPPSPRFAVICDAGKEAGQLQQKLQELIKNQGAGNAPFPVTVRKNGNLVAIVAGKTPELDATLGGKGKSIKTVKAFAAAMAGQKSPVIAGYVDTEAVIRFADKMVAQQGGPDAKQQWPAVKDALGLAGLKRVSFAAGFDGKDWGTHAFIEAPAPRKGLLAMLEAEPVSDDALRAIPSTATMAGVARLDLGGVFDAIRGVVAKMDPNADAQIDEGLKQVNEGLEIDVRQDVIEPLGNEWAYYIAPEITGRGPLGIVVVNRLADAEKAAASSEKLRELANNLAGQMLPPDMKVSFKQAKVGDVTVQYLATPLFTPSWVIQNGNLYLGLYPQLVAGAAWHVSREGKSILDNEDFAALRKRLGDQKATTYQFYDLPRSAPTNYQFWLLLSSLGKFGDLFGVDTPLMTLPPMTELTEHLSVAGSVTWTDDAGWHFRGITPFPGGTLVASETAGAMDVQTIGILMSLLLPAVQSAREQATRVATSSNLRQIGLGMHMYAAENEGRFPDDLAATQQFVGDPSIFVNPRSPGGSSPVGLSGDELKAWINESSGYVYIGAGKTVRDNGATTVVAYERPDGIYDGITFLFGDGHVEYRNMPQAMQTIEEAGGDARQGGNADERVDEPEAEQF